MGGDQCPEKAQWGDMKFALGTVQFGTDYGVSNRAGMVTRKEAARILDEASNLGIDTLDTAIAYGCAEEVLGELNCSRFQVISKLPGLPVELDDVASWVRYQIEASLRRMAVPHLDGLLLHRPADLLGSRGSCLLDALLGLKHRGLCRKIGFSIYAPQELEMLCPILQPDIVQAPMNLLDRRLETSGWGQRLFAANTEIHVRSAFLQGLLLMVTDELPAKFYRWRSLFLARDESLQQLGLSCVEACLGYVGSQGFVSRVVVGVQSVEQLRTIGEAGNSCRYDSILNRLQSDDELLLNPSAWSNL